MKQIFLILTVGLLGAPALALSCMRPDVAVSYQNAAEASEVYIVVKGTLTFNERLLPERDLTQTENKGTLVPARIKGVSLSRSGFDAPFERDITLDVQCFGPWCGGAASGVEYLAFLQRTGANYVMGIDPCGSFVFPEPTAEQVKQAEQCMAGEACTPQPF